MREGTPVKNALSRCARLPGIVKLDASAPRQSRPADNGRGLYRRECVLAPASCPHPLSHPRPRLGQHRFARRLRRSRHMGRDLRDDLPIRRSPRLFDVLASRPRYSAVPVHFLLNLIFASQVAGTTRLELATSALARLGKTYAAGPPMSAEKFASNEPGR